MEGEPGPASAKTLIYDGRDLPPSLRWQILSGLRCVWPEDYSEEHGPRDWICREEFRPVHVSLVLGGFVLSHTVVIRKLLEHAGQTYKVYGLSMVFSFPDCRGRGYGLGVVRAGTQYIGHTDADVAMLYCEPHLAGFYARNGWIPMETATTIIAVGGGSFSTGETLLMRFLSAKGSSGRPAFEREPIHFGDTTW